MKDCKFTVTVDGKQVVYDYDGFRYFLMQKGNLAKVAPEFAGASPLPKAKTSGPRTLLQEEPPATKVASWFSGTGTVEGALGQVQSVMAVEYDPAIVEQFNKAHSVQFQARDVASVSPKEVKDSGAELFHASPVCKNFSLANRNRQATDLDLVSAKAVARVIREAVPPVVTIENVPEYAKTELFGLITDALNEQGYNWRTVIIDAADLGAPQRRKRMIVQAVKEGELPPLPVKRTPGDWYESVKDLIKDAPDSAIPDWESRRLNAMVSRGLIDNTKPIITMGGSVGASVAAAANAGSPAPTLKASNQVARIILPDGQVKRVTPRMMARLMSLPDSFPVPDNAKLATTVLGNGVQGEMTRQLIKPLLGEPDNGAFLAGASPLPKSKRQPPAVMAGPTQGIDELDLYKKPEGLVEDPSKTPPPKPSKYRTGPEARAGLLEMDKQLEQEGLRLHRALIAARTPLTTVSRKRTQAEQDQLEENFRQAQRAFYSLAMDRRLALIDAIAPGGMADITWNNLLLQDKKVVTGFYESVVPVESELEDPAASAAIQRGVDFFRRIVGDHPDLKGATVTVRYHPQSNERAHFRPGRISYPQTGGGVKHVTSGNVLLAGADIHSWVIVHELGHWLEHLSDATLKRVIEFLKRRAGNELVRSFNTMGTGRTFDDLEVGVKDDFKDPYVGKYYGPNRRNFAGGKQGVANWDTVYGSEVISMGVEYLYSDPVKFAKDDPDYFDFMFDILRMGR